MRHNIEIPAKLHNRFIIEKRNIETGTVETYYAYNLITNTGFIQCFIPVPYVPGSAGVHDYRYIRRNSNYDTSYIGVGSGTGTLSPTRLNLFNQKLKRESVYFGREIDNDTQTSSYIQHIVILPEELVGTSLTEVGLFYNNFLLTHALITDAEGNPISITKTENDQITIYCQVFMQITNNVGSNLVLLNNNALLSLVYNNGYVYNHASLGFGVGLGTNKDSPLPTDSYVKSPVYQKTGCTHTKDTENFRLTVGTRFGTTEANGQKIWEIGMQWYLTRCEFGSAGWYPLFRSVIPVGTWTGHTIEDEEVGTGDGETLTYSLDWAPINADSASVFVDGVELIPGTEYTIDEETGEITFATAPPQDAVITATYSVTFIPKDDQHVLDVYVDINFADAGV